MGDTKTRGSRRWFGRDRWRGCGRRALRWWALTPCLCNLCCFITSSLRSPSPSALPTAATFRIGGKEVMSCIPTRPSCASRSAVRAVLNQPSPQMNVVRSLENTPSSQRVLLRTTKAFCVSFQISPEVFECRECVAGHSRGGWLD